MIKLNKKLYSGLLQAIYYNLDNVEPRLIFSDILQEDDDFCWWGELLKEYWTNGYLIKSSFKREEFKADLIEKYVNYIHEWDLYANKISNFAYRRNLILLFDHEYRLLTNPVKRPITDGNRSIIVNDKTRILSSVTKYFVELGCNPNDLLGSVL